MNKQQFKDYLMSRPPAERAAILAQIRTNKAAQVQPLAKGFGLPPAPSVGGNPRPGHVNILKSRNDRGSEAFEAARAHDSLVLMAQIYRTRFAGQVGVDTSEKGIMETLRRRYPQWFRETWDGTPGNRGLEHLLRTAVGGSAGAGGNWELTGFSTDQAFRMWFKYGLAAFLKQVEFPPNVDAYKLGVGPTEMVAGIGTTVSSDDPDAMHAVTLAGAATVTATKRKLEAKVTVAQDWLEDSSQDLGVVLDNIEQAHAKALDYAILNGDADGTHFDADTQAGANTLAQKVCNGITKAALANTKVNGGGVNLTLDIAIGAMKGLSPAYMGASDLMLICSPKSRIDLFRDAEVVSNAATPGSTTLGLDIANDALSWVKNFGYIYSTPASRDDIDATTAVQDAGGDDTFSRAILVNLAPWKYHTARPLTIEVVRDVDADATIIKSSCRFEVTDQTPSGDVSAVVIRNLITT